MADEFSRGVAKHLLGGQVGTLDQAAGGLEGNDPIHHGIKNRLDQSRTVAQSLLCGVFDRDIAEHQHRPHHLPGAVANRCTTVGNRTFLPTAGNQDGVVGEPLNGAARQGFLDRDHGWQTGFLVDDVKDLVHRLAGGFRLRPARELFGQRIQERHGPIRSRGNHGITNGMERHGEFFLTDLQGGIRLLKLAIHVLLNRERLLGFEVHQVPNPLLRFAIHQIDKCQRKQKDPQTDHDQNDKQLAHVHLKLGVGLQPGVSLEL